jgi:hypothetical protein
MADLVWTELRSSNVSKVAFDNDSDELLVEFRSGAIYSYSDQSEATLQDLITSTSPGSYVSKWLRNQPSRKVK